MLGARVIAVAVGYCFGLFQTGYIYGEKHGVDIRTQGSGNAGTTNTLRVLGWKAGLRRVRSSFGTQLPILSEI